MASESRNDSSRSSSNNSYVLRPLSSFQGSQSHSKHSSATSTTTRAGAAVAATSGNVNDINSNSHAHDDAIIDNSSHDGNIISDNGTDAAALDQVKNKDKHSRPWDYQSYSTNTPPPTMNQSGNPSAGGSVSAKTSRENSAIPFEGSAGGVRAIVRTNSISNLINASKD